MAIYYTKEKNLTNIANAIRKRKKLNDTVKFTPQQMVNAIPNLVHKELPSITIEIDPQYNEHQTIVVSSEVYTENKEFNTEEPILLQASIKVDDGWYTDGLLNDNYYTVANWGDTINYAFKNAARDYNLELKNFIKLNYNYSYYYQGGMTSLSDNDINKIKTSIIGGSAESAFENATDLTSISGIDTTINTSKITSMKNMFNNCNSLFELDLSNWDMSNVEDIDGMFNNCKNLSTFGDISNWNTAKIKSLDKTFQNCRSIIDIDLSNWNINGIDNINYLFEGCNSLKNVNLSGWDISKFNELIGIFKDCSSFETLNLSEWDTSNSISFKELFSGCTSLTNVNVSNMSLANAISLESMFSSCKSLSSLNITTWDTSNVSNMSKMFYGCENLEYINLSTLDGSNLTNISSMFEGSKLKQIDLSTWNPNISKIYNLNYMFRNCLNLEIVDFSNFPINTSQTYNLFESDNNLQYIILNDSTIKLNIKTINFIGSVNSRYKILIPYNLYNNYIDNHYNWGWRNSGTIWNHFDAIEDYTITKNNGIITVTPNNNKLNLYKYVNENIQTNTSITSSQEEYMSNKILDSDISESFLNSKLTTLKGVETTWDTSRVTKMTSIFNHAESLTSLNLSSWDTSHVINSFGTFKHCYKLTSVGDISNWNTSKFTNLGAFFDNCKLLQSVDLSSWDVSNVWTTESMFQACESLTSVGDLSNWNINSSRFTGSAGWMFYGCTNLLSVGDLSNWNLSKCTNFKSMFNKCEKLTFIGTSNWRLGGLSTDTTENMGWMFYNCKALRSLDVSNWNTRNANCLFSIFCNCESLTALDVSNWNTSSVTKMNHAFNNCKSLTSLNLSNWDTSKVVSMGSMFRDCINLETVGDISGWDLSSITWYDTTTSNNVTKTNTGIVELFYNCKSLRSVNVANWDMSKVDHVGWVFYHCESLTSLDLGGWRLGRYTTSYPMFKSMFCGCTNLKVIYFGRFLTWLRSSSQSSTAYDMSYMFAECPNLEYLIIDNENFEFHMNSSDCGGLNTTCKILVPHKIIDVFKNALNWHERIDQFDDIENYIIARRNGQVTVRHK